MNKEFIPYKQAVELKELGFEEPCLGFYDGTGTNQVYYNNIRNSSGDFEVFKNNERLSWFGVPTFSQAFRWFREKHKLTHSVRTFFNEEFYYEIYVSFNYEITSDKRNTYEEAELECLKNLIEIIKTK